MGLMVIISSLCRGETMDAASIKEFAAKIDSSLARGRNYHINYTYRLTRTDFYYDHNQELIKFLENHRADGVKNIQTKRSDGKAYSNEEAFNDLIKSFQKKLTFARQQDFANDYIVDEAGFYLKEEGSWINDKGVKGEYDPAIYASDGKIMGAFYPKNGQATLQPATERPQTAQRYWSDIAYQFYHDSIQATVELMQTLRLEQKEGKLFITGESPDTGKKTTKLILQIDKSTLRPEEIICLNYDSYGKLNRKLIKRWQYQDYSGVMLPNQVVDEVYDTGLDGVNKLSEQNTFTINSFTPTADSTKQKFAELLKSNYSIFDEITGTHYISGNPAAMLDKLSH